MRRRLLKKGPPSSPKVGCNSTPTFKKSFPPHFQENPSQGNKISFFVKGGSTKSIAHLNARMNRARNIFVAKKNALFENPPLPPFPTSFSLLFCRCTMFSPLSPSSWLKPCWCVSLGLLLSPGKTEARAKYQVVDSGLMAIWHAGNQSNLLESAFPVPHCHAF